MQAGRARAWLEHLHAAAENVQDLELWLSGDGEGIAQHDPVRWFGLADADRVVQVEVEWTDGTTTTVRDIAIGETIVVSY